MKQSLEIEESIMPPSLERDPISHGYHFEIDVCIIEMNTFIFIFTRDALNLFQILGNRHYPSWNITIPFKVVNTLVSYNTVHQDLFHDRLFVQVFVLGSVSVHSHSFLNYRPVLLESERR